MSVASKLRALLIEEGALPLHVRERSEWNAGHALAARLLSRNGYDVVNLSGGMAAWARAGLPVVGDKHGRR